MTDHRWDLSSKFYSYSIVLSLDEESLSASGEPGERLLYVLKEEMGWLCLDG